MTGYDIVLVGLQPYNSYIGTNTINIAEEFCKQNRVLYVNYPLDKKSLRLDKHLPNVKKRAKMMTKEVPNLIEVKPNLWNLYPNSLLASIKPKDIAQLQGPIIGYIGTLFTLRLDLTNCHNQN